MKDKRKLRKEKHKAKRECNNSTNESDPKLEKTSIDDNGEQDPSYQETVHEIKRRRKQKRRQRQKPHKDIEMKEKDSSSLDRGYEIHDTKSSPDVQYNKSINQGYIIDRSTSDYEESDDDDGDGIGFLAAANGQFAALALMGDDSDSE